MAAKWSIEFVENERGAYFSILNWKQLATFHNIPKSNNRIRKKRLKKLINEAIRRALSDYR